MPVVEDPPNDRTLADDLAGALTRLQVERGERTVGDEEEQGKGEEEAEDERGQVILQTDQGIVVSVLPPPPEADVSPSSASPSLRPSVPITHIKATIESMLPAFKDYAVKDKNGAGEKIEPTARPPV